MKEEFSWWETLVWIAIFMVLVHAYVLKPQSPSSPQINRNVEQDLLETLQPTSQPLEHK